MIRYLVFKDFEVTLRHVLRQRKKELASWLKPVSYERLWRSTKIPAGPAIFSDIERMSHDQMEAAARAWEALSKHVSPSLLLNHPTRSMRRYELLRYCYEAGINRFNVYRLTEWRQPVRFPVFIRDENLHGQMHTKLLRDPEALRQAAEAALSRGENRERQIIAEYCDTSDRDGLFRKYSVFVIGDEIIPRHIFFGREWLVKIDSAHTDQEKLLEEEKVFVRDNPHRDIFKKIFHDARIQYGRVDYGMLDGMPQIWEINTNPTVISDPKKLKVQDRKGINDIFVDRYVSAIQKLDSSAGRGQRVKINPSHLWRWAKKAPRPLKRSLSPLKDRLAGAFR